MAEAVCNTAKKFPSLWEGQGWGNFIEVDLRTCLNLPVDISEEIVYNNSME